MLVCKTVGRGDCSRTRQWGEGRVAVSFQASPSLLGLSQIVPDPSTSSFVAYVPCVVLDFLMVLILLLLIFRSPVELNVALESRSKTIENH